MADALRRAPAHPPPITAPVIWPASQRSVRGFPSGSVSETAQRSELEPRHQGMSESPTVRDFVERYLCEETPLKADSTQRHDALYARAVVASLGDLSIAALSPKVCASFHRALTAERGPVLANRVLSFVSQVCALAERDDERPAQSNPTRAIRRNAEVRRTNFLAPELRGRFLDAASLCLTQGLITRSAWTLICLMLLAGLRWSDVRHLRWDEVDERRGLLRFHPRGELRTENKSGDQRVVPLSDEALELITLSPRITGNPYVAAAPRTGLPYTDIRKPLAQVCELAGIRVTPHWLRHTLGTAAAESGCTPDEIAAVLGHRSNASAGRYVHLVGQAARRAARKTGLAAAGRAA